MLEHLRIYKYIMCTSYIMKLPKITFYVEKIHKINCILPYSRKYWRELNLAVEPQIAITRILADLILAVRYGIAIRVGNFWRILILRL